MKRCVILMIVLGLFGSIAPLAQQDIQATGHGSSSVLENGSVLYLELSKTVDAKKAKVGDPVSAVLLADVLSHGKIVFRQDTKLYGHVTEAQPRTKENPESRLGIVFDRILPKGGQETSFTSVLIALRPAPRIQIDALSPPPKPGMNPTGAPQEERHYPVPKTNTPNFNTTLGRETAGGAEEIRASDIDGLSLAPSSDGANRIVVSLKQTVKLEAGVRLELRVGNPNK